MSSPPSFPDQEHTDREMMDAEMEGTQDQTNNNNNNSSSSRPLGLDTSSSTLDHDYNATGEGGAQPAPSTSHHNRKDATLREFLSKMDDYAPIIPDAVTAHYLTLAGLPPPSPDDPTGVSTHTTPLPLARLLALATQKFISDIANDSYQYSRSRQSNSASANNPLGGGAGAIPVGQPAGGVGVGAGGAGGLKGQQAAQLGVQRSGYGGGGQGGTGQGKTVLTMEDLGMAVQDYGVNIKRAEFYR